jgi:hypothetical protein
MARSGGALGAAGWAGSGGVFVACRVAMSGGALGAAVGPVRAGLVARVGAGLRG